MSTCSTTVECKPRHITQEFIRTPLGIVKLWSHQVLIIIYIRVQFYLSEFNTHLLWCRLTKPSFGCVLMRKRKIINILKANAHNICNKYFKILKREFFSFSSAVLPGNIDLDHIVKCALKVGMCILSKLWISICQVFSLQILTKLLGKVAIIQSGFFLVVHRGKITLRDD